jgi:hypothetical protein
MVKITYIGKRNYRSIRTRQGNLFGWNNGETINIEDESLLEKLKGSKNFIEQKEIGPKTTGGGIKTHIRHPKRRGRPSKSKSEPKEKVKPPKSVIDKIKKPRGLRRPKRKTK